MNHLEAKRLVDGFGTAPGPLSPAESLYLRAVAWSEGGGTYGDGWRVSPQPINWGAMIAGSAWTGETFEYRDRDAAGREYVTRFRNYPDHESAARGLGMLLLRPNVRKPLLSGDLEGAVRAQIDENHYTGNPPATPASKYLSRVSAAVQTIVRATGEPNPFVQSPGGGGPPPHGSLLGLAVIGGALGWIGWHLFRGFPQRA